MKNIIAIKYDLIDEIVNFKPFIYYINGEAICLSIEVQERIENKSIIKEAKMFNEFCKKEHMFNCYKELGEYISRIKKCLTLLQNEAIEIEKNKRENMIAVSSKSNYQKYLCKQDIKDLHAIKITRKVINEFEIHEFRYDNTNYNILNDKINNVIKNGEKYNL